MNFFGTMNGRWHTFGQNLPAKFLIMGTIMYLFGCFQGSTEALQRDSAADALHRLCHLALTPHGVRDLRRLGDQPGLHLAQAVRPRAVVVRLGNWSFWLITAGISTMGLVLTAGGLMQGYMWMDGSEWVN